MPKGNRRPLWDEGEEPAQTAAPAAATAAAAPAPTAAAALAPSTAAPPPAFKQPCTFKGAASAVYAGLLGYFLGVVPAAIKLRGRQWGVAHATGGASARQLAIMSGLYTAVHCICQRIRLVEDGWNRGLAGCSTGLVLGWSNGPWSALQSCAGLGLISALIDLGGGAVEAAEARVLTTLQDMQARQQAAAAVAAQHAAQLEQGLRAPAHMALLLLGMPPASVDSLLGGLGGGSSSSKAAGYAQLPAPQQQQLVASFRAGQPVSLLQPAVAAVQQLLSAPPLMFLGACCHSSSSSSSGAMSAEVDACPVSAHASRRH